MQLLFFFFFFTGASSIPPVGFEKQPKVHFINDEFCTASTCDLIFRLPTINDGLASRYQLTLLKECEVMVGYRCSPRSSCK